MYFAEPNGTGGTNERRTISYLDGRNHIQQYNPDTIPIEWQAWMRNTRRAPPSLYELQVNLQKIEQLKIKVTELERLDQIDKQKSLK